MKFSEIINKYKDTDKVIWHSYDIIYDILFANLYKKNINFLEIGIYSGASTKSFEEYFGSDSKITAIDIDLSKVNYKYGKNVEIKEMDAYKKTTIDFLKLKEQKFDLILDDSMHDYDSHDYILTNYTELLKTKGLIVLEDCTYSEIKLMELCKKHKCIYIKNQHNLTYNKENNIRDYNASVIIIKMI